MFPKSKAREQPDEAHSIAFTAELARGQQLCFATTLEGLTLGFISHWKENKTFPVFLWSRLVLEPRCELGVELFLTSETTSGDQFICLPIKSFEIDAKLLSFDKAADLHENPSCPNTSWLSNSRLQLWSQQTTCTGMPRLSVHTDQLIAQLPGSLHPRE